MQRSDVPADPRPRRSTAWRGALVGATCALVGIGCSEAPRLVERPSEPATTVVIEDVGVLDVVAGRIVPHRDVLIEGERIAAVAPTGEVTVPEDVRRVSGTGRTLLPGLIDMHAHIGSTSGPPWRGAMPDPEANLRSFLYCGVTTVLDPADLGGQTIDLRQGVADGTILGPRIFTAGPMVTAPGGHPVAMMEQLVPWWIRWYVLWQGVREVDTAEEARAAVREIDELGADVVKLSVDRVPEGVPRMTREVIHAAVDEARQQEIRAVAHIGNLQDAIDAAEAGVAAWMHGVYKERLSDDDVRKLASYGIPMVPTTAVFESYALSDQPRSSTQLERETVPADVLQAFDQRPDDYDTSFFDPFLREIRGLRTAWRENVGRLHRAGVTILAGSDVQSGVFPGPGLHRELHLLHESGLSPVEAIRSATLAPARFLEETEDPDFGIVAAGKQADLLLVEGDPTTDLDALSRIRMVMLDGTVLERRRQPLSAR